MLRYTDVEDNEKVDEQARDWIAIATDIAIPNFVAKYPQQFLSTFAFRRTNKLIRASLDCSITQSWVKPESIISLLHGLSAAACLGPQSILSTN